MNDYLAAVIIGIVEGLTEFLPVSSTAHIRITQDFLGQDPESEYWKMFAIVIQLGAILSVVFYFRNRLCDFCRSFFRRKNSTEQNRPIWLHPLSLVLLSFVVTAIPCFIMDQLIGEQLENLFAIGCALLIGGVVMWVVDRMFDGRSSTEKLEDMNLRQAIWIGAAQILAATFPGTSRSMSTIAAGQIAGLSRTTALEFSFFLAIPVMIAATAFKLLQFLLNNPAPMTGQQWMVLAIGFTVSFLVAWASIAWLMQWVRKHGFVPFAIYRIAVGAWVIYLSLQSNN